MKYFSFLLLALFATNAFALAPAAREHIWFVDSCTQEPTSMVLRDWMESTQERVIGGSPGSGPNYRTVLPRVSLKIQLTDLDASEKFYLKVELLQQDENDIQERVIKKLVEKTKKANSKGEYSDLLNNWSLPLTLSTPAGRLIARVTWAQNGRGGVRSTSLLWRDNPEDVVQIDPKASCFWQGPVLFRSGYRSNNNAGLMTITERQYLYRNYGDRAGIDLGFNAEEFGSYYQLNRDSLSENDINALKMDRPFQGLLPGGVGAWFTASTRFEETRQDTLSLFRTYLLSAGEGGFYVGREVFARFTARRYCLSKVRASRRSCQVWRLCEEGEADIGFMDKGFTIVPPDMVNDPVATRNFVEAWQSLQETCVESPLNTTNFKRISQPNLDPQNNELPVIYFRGR